MRRGGGNAGELRRQGLDEGQLRQHFAEHNAADSQAELERRYGSMPWRFLGGGDATAPTRTTTNDDDSARAERRRERARETPVVDFLVKWELAGARGLRWI